MSATKNHYEITSDAKSTTILLQPDIGNAAWGDIERVGAELLSSVNDRKSSAWLVDLSKLEYMGSALVALLVRVWKAVQSGGGKIVVVCGDGMPRDVIRLAGLDKVWTISTTAADGYKTLGVRAPAPAGTSPDLLTAQEAPRRPDEGFPILGVLGFLAALLAGGALALVLRQAEIDRNLAQLGMYGGAGIAVALGFLSFLRETSWGRGLGCVALLAGIAVGILGYNQQPAHLERVPRPDTRSAGAGPPNQDGTDAQGQPAEPAVSPTSPDQPSDETGDASADGTAGNTDGTESTSQPPPASATDSPSPAEPSPGTAPAGDGTDPA